MANDRQANPEPSLGSRRRAIGLTKALKHDWEKVAANPPPVVGYHDFYLRAHSHEPCRYAAPFGRELDRIRENIPEDLLKAAGITIKRTRIDRLNVQPDPFASAAGATTSIDARKTPPSSNG